MRDLKFVVIVQVPNMALTLHVAPLSLLPNSQECIKEKGRGKSV